MTLTQTWAAHWKADPARVALVDASDGTAWTAAQLDLRSSVFAAHLASRGVAPGDRVLLSCAPSAETVAAYVGILRLGAVVVPANTGYTRAELDHIVSDVQPVLAVLDGDGDGDVDGDPSGAAAPPPAVDGRVPRLPLEPLSPSHTRATPSGIDAVARVAPRLDASADDDLAMIAFTSGTTGRPKGAMLTQGNLRAGAEALVTAWEWTADDRLVHALPMFHMHGLGVGINGSLTAGASMVVLPRFDADAVVDAVHAHDATLFFGVPTMYARLRDSGRLAELANLRLLVSGSAPLDPVLFQAIAESAGQAPVERYGMSETVMLTSNPVRGERRAGSVGLPLPDVEVRLGDGGTVEVRGPNVFDGYWKRPEATAEAFTDDGWFRTGDIGESDADGYLRLVGRASDLIITGGYNVYPREVEDAILEHADVVDVAVVGVGDETWGERVVAVVVLRDGVGLDVDALDAHLDDRVAAYKRPRSWTATDALPRNAMGKVRRDVLRDQHG